MLADCVRDMVMADSNPKYNSHSTIRTAAINIRTIVCSVSYYHVSQAIHEDAAVRAAKTLEETTEISWTIRSLNWDEGVTRI